MRGTVLWRAMVRLSVCGDKTDGAGKMEALVEELVKL